MKKLLFISALFISFFARGQAIYNPGYTPLFTVSNKPYAMAKAGPDGGRTYKADSINFLWRPFNGITEVKSYFPASIPMFRTGQFPIVVNVGGALQSNGTFIGGTIHVYWWKQNTADSSLVEMFTDPVSTAGFLLAANNLSDLASIPLAKQNLALDLVNNTSDATKNSATVSLTNHTIDANNNTLLHIPNSALTNNSIGLNLTATGSDVSIPVTPAALGAALTINIPTGSGSARGVIQSTDFTKFNNKLDSTSMNGGDSVYDWVNGVPRLRYVIVGGSATPTLQQVLSAGSTLLGDNIIDANNHQLNIDSTSFFGISTKIIPPNYSTFVVQANQSLLRTLGGNNSTVSEVGTFADNPFGDGTTNGINLRADNGIVASRINVSERYIHLVSDSIQLTGWGSGTHLGLKVHGLAEDALGNIIEDTTTSGGGGGSTLTLGSGLTGGSYNGSTPVTTNVDTAVIAPRHNISDSLNYALLNAVNTIDYVNTLNNSFYQNDSLKTCKVLNIFIDNVLLPARDLGTGNSYWTFDGSTGAVEFNQGLLDTGSYVRILYKKLPWNTTYPLFNVVLDGNSIPKGSQTTDSTINSIYAIMSNTAGAGTPFQRIFINNQSVGNQTLDTIIGGITQPQSKISRYASTIRPLIQVGKRNILIIWEEVNQLYYGESIGRYKVKLKQYCDTARADGWEVLVVAQSGRDTTTNHGFFNTPTSGLDTYGMNLIQATDTINTWMRTAWLGFANGIIDVASIPILKEYPDSNSTYHYSFDGIHYTDYGCWLAGNFAANALLSYMNEAVPNQYYVVNNTAALSSYLTTANITNTAQIAAVTSMFSQLSQGGLWQYVDQLYPVLGDNVTSYQVNAKVPGSSTLIPINPGGGGDALTYSSSLGLTTSGNARVEVPRRDSSLRKTSYGIFIYTNLATGGGTPYLFGDGPMSGRFNGTNFDALTYNSASTFSQAMNFPPYTGVDAYYVGRNVVNREGLVRTTTSESIDAPAGLSSSFLNGQNIPFGVYYFDNTPSIFPATVPVRFATIAITKGLPANKVALLASIIHTYNTALNRSYLQVH